MSNVQKINGFAAPYRSLTLRNETAALVNRRGVVSIEQDVFESGGNVIIPAFTIVQNGMLIRKDVPTSVVKPIGLTAPYYVTVSAPTAVNVDDLVFQFARTPDEVSDSEVILAEFDGLEWRQLPRTSIDGLIRDQQQSLIDLGQLGPKDGLKTTVIGPNYKNSKGVVVDKTGLSVRLDENFLTPIIADDPDWRRVDRMIYRRPRDEDNRIGQRKLVVGSTYSLTPTRKLYDTQIGASSAVHRNPRVIIDSTNAAHFFYSEGYGETFNIIYQKYASNRTTQNVPPTIITSSTSQYFDVAQDSAGELHVAFIQSGNLRWLKLSALGNLVSGPFTVDTQATPCDQPVVLVDSIGAKVCFVYRSILGPLNNQLFFASLTLNGAVITAPVQITNTASNLINHSAVMTFDQKIHVAYEDNTFGKIYYAVRNDIGALVSLPVSISGATGSTSFGTLVDQARSPIVQVADNQEVFVFFLQKKTISTTGLSIYSNNAAFMPNLIGPSEDIVSFAAQTDSALNEHQLCISQAGRVDYVKVDNLTVVLTEQIGASGGSDVAVVKDQLGSLVHSFALPIPASFTNTNAPQTVTNIGPAAVAGGLNTLVLASNEFSMDSTGLGYIPKVGDQATIAGSSVGGNNVSKVVTAVSLQSINAPNDVYVVQVDSSFAGPETPALITTSQFANPDGNQIRFIKTVGELDETRALRNFELSSDNLLARIALPGPVILNYIPASGFGVNSDLFGMYGDTDVDWSASFANTLTMSTGTRVVDLTSNIVYQVGGGAFPMAEDDALYCIFDGVTTAITPQVAKITHLPWGLPIQVLGFVKNGEFNPHLFSVAGMGQLDVGESVILGQDLSKAIRIRLGITGENTYQAYPSATQIAPSDNYPTAIGKLDAVLNSVVTNLPIEEKFTVTNPLGQTIFTTTAALTFQASNVVVDIEVYVNGVKQDQDETGGLNADYRKTSTNTIEFAYTVPKDAKVTIREERTGGIGSNATDLQNISVDISPISNGAFAIGTVAKAWKELFIKDKLSSQVYKLEIVGGVVQWVPVP